jgi:hypothetical protein
MLRTDHTGETDPLPTQPAGLTKGVVRAPDVTFPKDIEDFVRGQYKSAEHILEYGSGGSTVIAGQNTKGSVLSVESDLAWANMMKAWFVANPPTCKVRVHHVDIGPTKEWGWPESTAGFRNWPGYANSVWDVKRFRQPDMVLIDGRFRLACFLTVLFRTKTKVTVLWDDYTDRPQYHCAEDLLKPVAFVGRMAVFEVQPTAVPSDRLGWIAESYLKPA